MLKYTTDSGKRARARCPWGPLAGLLAILGCDAAFADHSWEHSNGEEVYFGDLPVVLAATRLNQPIAEAPVAVTVIDREMIEASGARELADVFRLVPGFLVGSFDGHQRTVGYHGLLDSFNRRMQVLVDGRSVYTPTFGGVKWSDLPLILEDIERIEVVRGPNAATYGPNSFLGIISITTRHAADTPNTLVKAATGSPDYGSAVVRHGSNRDDLDFRISVQRERDSGFDNVQDSKVTDRVNLRTDYQATARDGFVFNTGINTGKRGEGMGSASNPNREIDATSYFVQGRWRRIIGPMEEISVQLYYNSFDTEDRFFATDGPLSGTIDFSREGRRTDIEFEHIVYPNDLLKIAWGIELRHDEGRSSNVFLGGNVKNDVRRLFGNVVWEITPATLVNAGAMLEENDLTGTDVSPRVALNHRLNNRHSLRATLSHATRTPSFFEGAVDLFHILDFAGTPVVLQSNLTQEDVESETIDSIEVGYIFNLPDKSINGDIKLFREKIRNLVSAYRFPLATSHGLTNVTGTANSFRNGDDATIEGIELQLEWFPTDRDRLVFGGALLDIDSDDAQEPFSETVPDSIFSLLWIHRAASGLSTGLAYYYTDDFRYLDGNHKEEIRRLDLRVAQKLGSRNRPCEIALVFQNLLGTYVDFQSSNAFGTRAYLTVSTQF